ncbi:MAG TPA: ABC transporter permease [Bryobacteraceae bacterium]|jgi:putative ABC transport system permease protein|nr:ABC transporter permease [Bryobacteraceae bacterium]
MAKDLRYGVRMLLKQPGFTLIAVLTLALGVGATSAVFSLIQGVLLTPPPYRQPEQLVLIESGRADGQEAARAQGWAPAQWMDWQNRSKSFEGIAAYNWSFNFLVLPNGSESLEGMWVTRDYFRVAGLQPLLGRTFTAAETSSTPAPVIILGYNLWQRQFNGDPNIIGKKIRISRQDTPPKVIGVMPPGVRFLPSPTTAQEPNYDVNALVDFWIPAVPDPKRLKEAGWNVVGRLRPGTTLRQAHAELTVLAAREAQAERDFSGIIPHVQSLSAELNRDGSRILLPLLGAAALVLLIACGNVAALLLVRGLQRQQEYAVRSALGVGRVALFRQVSTETLLLALVGGSFGIGLAFGIVKLFKLIGGHAIPRLDAVAMGWPVLGAGLGSAILAALLAGLFPALRASRMDPALVLKSGGPNSSAGRAERRLLRGVTTVQTALTLALLVGAGLLIRTMSNLSKVQSGYDTAHILTMSVTAVQGDWADFHRRALERVAALPGVQHVAFAWGVPLTGNNWPDTIDIEGQPAPSKASDRISAPLRAVTPDYFKLLGLAIADGRDFCSSDTRTAPSVAVVNQALADRYFPRENAIGKKLWLFGNRQQPATIIVGVVTNGRTDDLTEAAQPEIYLSLWQASAFSKHLVIQTAADPRALMVLVQRELRSVDPTVAIENVKTLDEIRSESLASRNFAMQLLVGFSLVGSVLTLVGIYGVLSLSVASRRREIAIRSAVGAMRRDIRNLVFAEGFRLIAGGIISGIAAALVLSRVLKSFLFEVQPTDPATLIGVGFLFASVALFACWAPTRRATKVDPLEALRYE